MEREAREEVTEDWEGFGVRPDAIEAWRTLGADAFVAALGQGDGAASPSRRPQWRQAITRWAERAHGVG